MEKISVIGLGKLGSSMLACFAHKGWDVIGVDVLQSSVNSINNGHSPIYEPGVEELINTNSSRIKATQDIVQATLDSSASFIIVPTPSRKNGSFTIEFVEKAIRSIGLALKNKDSYHLVIVTSTVMPGDTERMKDILEDVSGKTCGEHFGVCYNPDFIALGKVVHDFLNPDMILIGESDIKAGDILSKIHEKLIDNDPSIHRMSFHNAELAKIGLNSYCVMKICFANIIGEICERMPTGDAEKVLDAIGADTRVGKKYFKPGLAAAGPCVKPETLIQTNDGMKPIIALNIGDKVLTHLGRYRKITKIFTRPYKGSLIKITAMGYPSKPIITTPDHPIWAAKRLTKGNKYRMVATTGQKRLGITEGFGSPDFFEAYKLKHADAILMPVLNLDPIEIPVLSFKTHSQSPLPARLEITPRLLKFFGFYISEGSSWNEEIKISLHKKETEFAEEIKTIVTEHFGLHPKIKPHGDNGIKVKFSCVNLAPYLKATFGGHANEKRVPLDWLALPEEYLIELLRGIWYGDGSRSEDRLTFGTVSPELCRFIQLAFLRFGIASTVRVAEARTGTDGVKHQRAYFLRVDNGTFFPEMNRILPELFIKAPKGSNLSWCKDSAIGYNIKEVSEEPYDGLVYNLEVEEDNSYVLEWGTVHNCFPRDSRAFRSAARSLDIDFTFSEVADEINSYHKNTRIPNLLLSILNEKSVTEISVLGMSYKEDINVIDESAAIEAIKQLAKSGVSIKVYDPASNEVAKKELASFPEIEFCNSAKECIEGTEVCFIGTPWKEFRQLSVEDFTKGMGENPTVFDSWGIYRSNEISTSPDIDYRRIGKPNTNINMLIPFLTSDNE
jgi:UDPglucose 6-dehydrogenase